MKSRRVVFEKAGCAVVREFELPPPGPGQVLLETDYTVLSAGTEKAMLLGLPNTPPGWPKHPGYSGAGRVVAVGEGVDGLRPGHRVIISHGGHAAHAVRPAAGTVRIEDEAVSTLEAAFVVIASMSLQGVRKARLELGESVLVAGLGILGLFAVQLARLSGGLPVLALDFSEARRRLAGALGADRAFSPDEAGLADRVREATRGRGAEVVIEVSGASRALNQVLACSARRARVVLLGCTRVSADLVDFYRDVHRAGVSIIGAHNFVRPERDSSPGYWTRADDFRALLDLLAAGRFSAAPLASEVVPASRAPDVYRRLAGDDGPPPGLVFDWRGQR